LIYFRRFSKISKNVSQREKAATPPSYSYCSDGFDFDCLGVDLEVRSLHYWPYLRQEIRGLRSVYTANMAGYQWAHLMSSELA
jgi:hypothetical protein